MLNINNLKIGTLCENTASDIFYLGEWGLSVLLDRDKKDKILFDTGAGNTILHNADVMGVDLSKISKIVLSHGHQDHTGGLRPLLERIHYLKPDKEIDIISHPDATKPKYVRNSSEDKYFYRGIPYNLKELERLGGNFEYYKKTHWITNNIVSSGEIPMSNEVEPVSEICYLKNDEGFYDDPVLDDQALYITTNQGLIVILGCAHRGIINTINHARQVTEMEEVYMVIGGTHLANASQERLDFTLEQLQKLNVKKLGVSHCTGMRSAAFFVNKLSSEKFFYNNAGTEISFDGVKTQITSF